jgi:hypothetical protein
MGRVRRPLQRPQGFAHLADSDLRALRIRSRNPTEPTSRRALGQVDFAASLEAAVGHCDDTEARLLAQWTAVRVENFDAEDGVLYLSCWLLQRHHHKVIACTSRVS